MSDDDEFYESNILVGQDVTTPEGVKGEVTGSRWDDDEGDWMHAVKWEDGQSDEQSETYLLMG